MKFINILIFAVLLLTSCGNKVEFYGEMIEVAYPEHIDTLTGHALKLEGEYTDYMSAHDGVLLFFSMKHPDGYVYLYDAKTGQRINAICKRGDGPDEVIHVDFFECFEKDSSGICMWVYDINKSNFMLVNRQGHFVKRIKTSILKSNDPFYGRIFVLNDSLLLAYLQAVEIFQDKVISPHYSIFNYETGEQRKEYKFYSDYSVNNNTEVEPIMYLSSFEGIKPDKSKLVMAMTYLNRINIFDIKSGKIKSIGTKDTPDLNTVLSGESMKPYYGGVRCDDRYIYVIEGTYNQLTGKINVFDWSGNFTNVLQVNKEATFIAFDAVLKTLYTKNDTEEIMAYDLKFLYE